MSQITSADEFSDFEVLGMSIGDSLLEYMSQGDILKGIERNKNVTNNDLVKFFIFTSLNNKLVILYYQYYFDH